MKRITFLCTCLFFALSIYSQSGKRYLRLTVGFYNLENLFDTINHPDVRDEDFTPDGLNKWDVKKYQKKLENLAHVISQIGGLGPTVLGVAEVENMGVLEDLVDMPALRNKGYGIVHYDSPDRRGIDVGLLYMKNVFQYTSGEVYHVRVADNPNFRTRDILRASGYIDGEKFHFLVGHWPSRSGGEAASMHLRMAAAKVMRHVTDSLLSVNPNANVVLMGDFNDDPVSPSVIKGLQAKSSPKRIKYNELFTPMAKLYREGIGSLAYRDVWNLFDIIAVNGNLLRKDYKKFKLYTDPKSKNSAFIFNKPFLLQKEGPYKGYPLRTIVGGEYQGGYSDHFPVYIYLVKEI